VALAVAAFAPAQERSHDPLARARAQAAAQKRYADSTVPRHVHCRVWAEDRPVLESECFFAGDPNLSESARRTAEERGFPIIELQRDAHARDVGALLVRVPKE
jgi:hypothetical protein